MSSCILLVLLAPMPGWRMLGRRAPAFQLHGSRRGIIYVLYRLVGVEPLAGPGISAPACAPCPARSRAGTEPGVPTAVQRRKAAGWLSGGQPCSCASPTL